MCLVHYTHDSSGWKCFFPKQFFVFLFLKSIIIKYDAKWSCYILLRSGKGSSSIVRHLLMYDTWKTFCIILELSRFCVFVQILVANSIWVQGSPLRHQGNYSWKAKTLNSVPVILIVSFLCFKKALYFKTSNYLWKSRYINHVLKFINGSLCFHHCQTGLF